MFMYRPINVLTLPYRKINRNQSGIVLKLTNRGLQVLNRRRFGSISHHWLMVQHFNYEILNRLICCRWS